jgi:hypothetical protein
VHRSGGVAKRHGTSIEPGRTSGVAVLVSSIGCDQRLGMVGRMGPCRHGYTGKMRAGTGELSMCGGIVGRAADRGSQAAWVGHTHRSRASAQTRVWLGSGLKERVERWGPPVSSIKEGEGELD